MSQKRLFLLDAYALIFRGYYAFIKNPRINSKGMDTSAIMGFMNALMDVIKREKPDHLAVAFDKGGSTFRLEMFEQYKANRDATPEAIKIAVPYIQDLLRAMHIPIVEVAGFEADDLIGTIAKQAEKENYQVFMVTPDKDFAQLVSENIFMYKPARMGNGIEIWGIPEVQKRFEVETPEQVIDYLGMMGDAVDNIPGLPGVGEKTAKKFLKQYGSMENLLANTHELKGKMKENIEANKDLGILSKQLATIILDCPVEFHEGDYELNHPDFEKAGEIFKELEFRRIAENMYKIFNVSSEEKEVAPTQNTSTSTASTQQFDLFSLPPEQSTDATVISGYQSTNSYDHFYQHITTPLSRKLLISNLLKQQSVSYHLETTDDNCFETELVGMSFSYESGKGYYIPLAEDTSNDIMEEFKVFFENTSIEKIGQDIKWDIKVLHQKNIQLKGKLFDIMLAHYLINPDMRHDMSVLTETYLNF